jgi:hypothetical protein
MWQVNFSGSSKITAVSQSTPTGHRNACDIHLQFLSILALRANSLTTSETSTLFISIQFTIPHCLLLIWPETLLDVLHLCICDSQAPSHPCELQNAAHGIKATDLENKDW